MVKEDIEDTTEANQSGKTGRERYRTLIAWFETALIVLGLLGIMFLLPHNYGTDGWIRFNALSEMLNHGKMPTIIYSMVGPLFSIPFGFWARYIKLLPGGSCVITSSSSQRVCLLHTGC